MRILVAGAMKSGGSDEESDKDEGGSAVGMEAQQHS